jgi:uncharacterized protein
MKNGLVIADSGPIFSLALVDRLNILDVLFDEIKIPQAVWDEITLDESVACFDIIVNYFKNKVEKITQFNELTFIMDYGESESITLYRELNANFLLVDDKKARRIAENLNITCIGTLGLLIAAKDKGIIKALKPIFEEFLKNKRYYSLNLLNTILKEKKENSINLSG